MSTFREANGIAVFVREYLRLCLGKWETVKSHLRNWPCSRRTISN
jgi:hypothetical protein